MTMHELAGWKDLLGCSQAVRHGVLIPAFPGSNPGTPVINWIITKRIFAMTGLEPGRLEKSAGSEFEQRQTCHGPLRGEGQDSGSNPGTPAIRSRCIADNVKLTRYKL
jgi:hypothetical protein